MLGRSAEKLSIWACLLVCVAAISLSAAAAGPTEAKVEMALDISRVPASFPVGFCLLTTKKNQFAVYYDAQRRMTIAYRSLDSRKWRYQILPSKVGWDSHNYVTMAIDSKGSLHLSGNMHCVPLVYFRTEKPEDPSTFRQHAMIGSEERNVTYPRFLKDLEGRLIFHYRSGACGHGNEIFNVYDTEAGKWRRLLDRPLIDGKLTGMYAYRSGPSQGPDRWFHVALVWRDTGDCRTCHDISYARSRDLIHWETAAGGPLTIPFSYRAKGIMVDPVPARGGLINMGFGIGFDADRRPIVTYHKYDAKGNSQIYNARFENGKWKVYRTSDWSYRWNFGGGGAIDCAVWAGRVTARADGSLVQSFRHPKAGSGTWKLDPKTLKPVGRVKTRSAIPGRLRTPESKFPGLKVKWRGDSGSSGEGKVRYMLRWETLGANRDRPRKPPLPEPSMLRLYKLRY
jgi:hypothetical protein